MHGHLPQQHPGLHPAHQPPPHLTHLANLPPHSIPRDHPANRLSTARHHLPRGVDHHQTAGGMAPHLPMQVPPPPPPHQAHQAPPPPPQNPRKPPGGPPYYANGGGIHVGLSKPVQLTAAHMHPPPSQPPPQMQPQQQQQQHPGGPMPLPSPVVSGKLAYGMGGMGQHGKQPMQQQQQQQQQQGQQQQHQPQVSVHHSSVAMAPPPAVLAPIPVVSAATPAGTKTRHIPSSTDHKLHHHNNHHHGQHQSSNGSKGGMMHAAGNQQHRHIQQQHAPLSVKAAPTEASCAPSAKEHHHQGTTTVAAPANPTPTDGTIASAAESTPKVSAGDGTSGTATATATATLSTTLSSSNSLETLANIKEKTTMCLVNELARYNKIQHQYRLTGESGPAHKKRFTVTLKLGDEEYTAEGASIKKAQHKAAGDAIAATKYKHPPARTKPRAKTGPRGNVSSFTPTVELNALAMKRGEPTVYQVKAVALPPSKYPPAANGMPPGTGRKLPPGASHPPPAAMGYGPGRYGDVPAAGGGAPPGGGYWGRGGGGGGGGGVVGVVAGVGGRGGIGGFHPGHQQHQQQHHHAHHPRAGGQDDHHGQHQHHHHNPHLQHHHHHHHDGCGGGGGGGGPQHYGHPGPGGGIMPVQEFYKATLRVGERTFLGEGHSPQAARHDAAARALEVLKPLTAEGGADGKGRAAAAAGGGGGADGEANGEDGSGAGGADGDPNAELKSPISLVHEMAVQRNVPVVFEVISEKGPPHMTVFVTQCRVGTIVTEGEGTGKKPSKKRAAEKMLEELRKLQKAEQQQQQQQQQSSSSSYNASWGGEAGGGTGGTGEKRKANSSKAAAAAGAAASLLEAGGTAKKKARNLIKEKSTTGGDPLSEKENPISRLMQIQQARKEKQPVYTLVENERPNVGRRRQFTIEVSAAGKKATGAGMTKKAAKWNAAEALLVELGFAPVAAATKGSPATNAATTANKENQSGAANEAPLASRKVTFVEGAEQGGNVGSKATTASETRSPLAAAGNQGATSPRAKNDTSKDSMNDSTASNDSMATTSSGVSSTSSVAPAASSAPCAASSPSAPSNPDIGRKKEQLLYLAQLLKFEVQFSDFPKGNHGEYLTLVVLTTEPPQLCHGSGASLQESQDEAARCALEMLSKIGLDNVKPKAAVAPASSSAPAADGGITATGGGVAGSAEAGGK